MHHDKLDEFSELGKRRMIIRQHKKINHLRIAVVLLLLLAVYGVMGRMDRAAQAERMNIEKPGAMQPQVWRVWI